VENRAFGTRPTRTRSQTIVVAALIAAAATVLGAPPLIDGCDLLLPPDSFRATSLADENSAHHWYSRKSVVLILTPGSGTSTKLSSARRPLRHDPVG
jgi:hypothetical protein